jgi:hypothetical protein
MLGSISEACQGADPDASALNRFYEATMQIPDVPEDVTGRPDPFVMEHDQRL